MALRRYTRPIDGSIPIPALLYNDEQLLASQDAVGIYDGLTKAPDHQSGSIHVSTHRLFYIDAQSEQTHSFVVDLAHVSQTEFYAGLFKSSPKVTLYLSSPAASGTDDSSVPYFTSDTSESWECGVCAYRNPPGLSPAAARICALCGVPRNALDVPESSRPSSSSSLGFSSSLPSSPPKSSPSIPKVEVQAAPSSISCPACTFLNHPSLRSCELCSTPLPQVQLSVRNHAPAKSAPVSRPSSPDSDSDDKSSSRFIKVSFRKGGDKVFYAALKRSLKGKAWEVMGSTHFSTVPKQEAEGHNALSRTGINGILKVVETSAHTRNTDLQDSLKDLEALMVKAKEMVRIAGELNERLTATSTIAPAASTLQAPTLASSSETSSSTSVTLIPSTEPEEATFIRSSLAQLGLQMTNTPVTLDMMKDERRWIEELARELSHILQGTPHTERKDYATHGIDEQAGSGLMGQRGILALDEVWGGWNRARGVALIPPSTFLQVLPHLSAHTEPPVRMRTFASGLSVLHTPPYTDAAFAARLASLLALAGPRTTLDVAQEERLTVGLTDEMLRAVEEAGHVCRDDPSAAIRGGGTGSEVRWWTNIFRTYIWDGQTVAEPGI